MGEVEVFVQRRFRCPHCRRSWASKSRATKHAAACWRDPGRRTCITCVHHHRGYGASYEEPGSDEYCTVDAALHDPDGRYVLSVDCTDWTPDGAVS